MAEGDEFEDQGYLDDQIYEKIQFGEFSKYLHNKRIKTQFQNRQFQQIFKGDAPQILAGYSFYIDGQTEIPIAELQTCIKIHGGTIVPVLDRKGQVAQQNGFIVASNLTPAKRTEFKNCKVVKEEWILDSCSQGRLLDWREYVLRPDHQINFGNGQFPGGTPVAQPTLLDMRPKQSTSAARSPQSKSPGKSLKQMPRENQQFEHLVPGYAPSKPAHRTADLLQNEAWRTSKTAVAPDFIEGYYKNSRLHHLSTWKAELPTMIANLTADLLAQGKSAPPQQGATATSRNKPLSGTAADGRCIMHVDFDSMFAAASLLSRPDLKGQPVAVCHAKGDGSIDGSTSEIASCSYEARDFGVKNGMSLGQARRLCPQIQPMPYDFDLYASMSSKFYKILLSHADQLQPVSVDECYIEVSSKLAATDVKDRITAFDLAEAIRDEVREATLCEVSIGIGHNLVLARLATKKAKPAKAYHLVPKEVNGYLGPLKVNELPGVGYAVCKKFESLGVATISDLLSVSRAKVLELLGPKFGAKLLGYAQGVDVTPLQPPGPRRSISAEVNYGLRFSADGEVETFLRQFASELVNRLNALATRGGHLTLKVMKRADDAPVETPKFLGHGVCDVMNATHSFNIATADANAIFTQAWRMLQGFSIPCYELRGLGLQMTKLESMAQHNGQQRLAFAASKAALKGPAGKARSPEAQQTKRSRSPSSSPPRVTKAPATAGAAAGAPRKSKPIKQVMLMPEKTKASVAKKVSAPMQAKISTDGALQLAVKERRVPHPNKITDTELRQLGIDPGFFRAIPYTMQQDSLSNIRNQLIQDDKERSKLKAFEVSRGFRGLMSTSSEAQLERIDADQLNAPTPGEPMFKKLEDNDDIREKLRLWVERIGTRGPAQKDVLKVEEFLLRCLEPQSRSPDLERVTLMLEWLRWVISRQPQEAQAVWQPAFDALKGKIDNKVVKLKGRKLVLS